MPDTELAPRRRGRPASGTASEGGAEVQSLDRAIALLRVVADQDGMALAEIARRAELPVSTVHRLLTTLEKRQLVNHDLSTGLWTVGLGLFRIGAAYLRIRKLPDIGRPVIRRLLHETDETVNLAMFDAMELVVVAQAEALALPTVPVLFRGVVKTERDLRALTESLSAAPSAFGGRREGVVVRRAEGFDDAAFPRSLGKWVRKDHVTTDEHWMHQSIRPQRLR